MVCRPFGLLFILGGMVSCSLQHASPQAQAEDGVRIWRRLAATAPGSNGGPPPCMTVSFDKGFSEVQGQLTGAQFDQAWNSMDPGGSAQQSLRPELLRRLRQAAATVVATQRPYRLVARIARWRPSYLHSEEELRRCPNLSLSSAVIVGDIAFVDVSLRCGAICGSYMLVALQRRGADWQPIAWSPTELT
jgi:hypothetical protein